MSGVEGGEAGSVRGNAVTFKGTRHADPGRERKSATAREGEVQRDACRCAVHEQRQPDDSMALGIFPANRRCPAAKKQLKSTPPARPAFSRDTCQAEKPRRRLVCGLAAESERPRARVRAPAADKAPDLIGSKHARRARAKGQVRAPLRRMPGCHLIAPNPAPPVRAAARTPPPPCPDTPRLPRCPLPRPPRTRGAKVGSRADLSPPFSAAARVRGRHDRGTRARTRPSRAVVRRPAARRWRSLLAPSRTMPPRSLIRRGGRRGRRHLCHNR